MRKGLAAIAAAVVLSAPASAQAYQYTWTFTGEVTGRELGSNPDRSVPFGTRVEFSVTMDTTAPDLCAGPGSGLYFMPSSSMTILGQTYHALATAVEVNSAAGNCSPQQDFTIRLLQMPGAPFFSAIIGWGVPFGVETPPTTIPSRAFFGLSNCGPVCADHHGVITSATLPEPTALALLGLGLAGVAVVRRRRRHDD